MEEDQQIEEGQRGHMLVIFICYETELCSLFGLLFAIDPIHKERCF
jgi:hypothetical protein